ncbi:MAG: DEAD/DEAH box helicase [Crocinitomicaceae bacterium]|nr:DEAD/DEAH box helicase [Crocinitomicaceae bacterium]
MSELKLNKLLKQGLTENGIQDLYEYQTKLIRRINGGVLFIYQGPSGTGKTTAMIIAVLQKLNYSQPDTPRAILMLSTGEDAAALYNQFKKLPPTWI